MDDREIIALFYARSEQAIDELRKRHGAFISKVAFNILHDARDAEEAVNDTYSTLISISFNSGWTAEGNRRLGRDPPEITNDPFSKENGPPFQSPRWMVEISGIEPLTS